MSRLSWSPELLRGCVLVTAKGEEPKGSALLRIILAEADRFIALVLLLVFCGYNLVNESSKELHTAFSSASLFRTQSKAWDLDLG